MTESSILSKLDNDRFDEISDYTELFCRHSLESFETFHDPFCFRHRFFANAEKMSDSSVRHRIVFATDYHDTHVVYHRFDVTESVFFF